MTRGCRRSPAEGQDGQSARAARTRRHLSGGFCRAGKSRGAGCPVLGPMIARASVAELEARTRLLMVGEASSAASTNRCVSRYLTQAGVPNTWVDLGPSAWRIGPAYEHPRTSLIDPRRLAAPAASAKRLSTLPCCVRAASAVRSMSDSLQASVSRSTPDRIGRPARVPKS